MARMLKYFLGFMLLVFLSSCTDAALVTFVEAVDPLGSFTEKNLPYGDLHVDGRYLVGENGQNVRLHGFAQTYQPFYNENAWDNYDVEGCLNYNKKKINQVLSAGWQMTFMREHMDPYWCAGTEEDKCYININYDDFEYYLDKLYIPMAEYAIAHGLYVLMRPPGVSPEEITTGDDYNKYLIKIWDIVSSHPSIKNNPGIMFELANEPVNIEGTDGSMGGTSDAQFAAMSEFLQPIVDVIRGNGANNVIWLPGLGYQSHYEGFMKYPVTGDNLGFAIHCYPGWYGSDAVSDSGEGLYGGSNGGYATFQAGWNSQMSNVPDNYPIIVTEMDWSNGNVYYMRSGDGSTYSLTWGQGVTGTAGGMGFGANFKYITDNCGNVSFLIFTGQEYLAQFVDEAPEDDNYTFYNDPENSCLWTAYHWYEEYAGINSSTKGNVVGLKAYIDGEECVDGDTYKIKTGNTSYIVLYAVYSDGSSEILSTNENYTVESNDASVMSVQNLNELTGVKDGTAVLTMSYQGLSLKMNFEVTSFPLDGIDANIWGDGNTYNSTTHTLQTDAYGFGGWQYSNGLDLSDYRYLVVEFCNGTNVTGGADIRIFDENSYWSDCASYTIDNYRMVIDLTTMKTSNSGEKMDPSHIYILGFWTMGGSDNKVVLNDVYVTNNYPTGEYIVPDAPEEDEPEIDDTGGDGGNDLYLSLDDIDYNIWNPNGTASYNNITHTLILDSYGFGGWQYPNGLDLSGYRYLVIETEDGTNYDEGIFFRMFDENSYWSSPSNTAIKSNRTVIDLRNQTIDDDFNEGYRSVDTSHIYILGFWSYGGENYKIVIKNVYATNSYPSN